MKGIDYQGGLELLRGYSKIEDFVRKNGYSPFDYEALKVIHTAYIACAKVPDCIETKIKEEARNIDPSSQDFLMAHFNNAINALSRNDKLLHRMISLYFDELL